MVNKALIVGITLLIGVAIIVPTVIFTSGSSTLPSVVSSAEGADGELSDSAGIPSISPSSSTNTSVSIASDNSPTEVPSFNSATSNPTTPSPTVRRTPSPVRQTISPTNRPTRGDVPTAPPEPSVSSGPTCRQFEDDRLNDCEEEECSTPIPFFCEIKGLFDTVVVAVIPGLNEPDDSLNGCCESSTDL